MSLHTPAEHARAPSQRPAASVRHSASAHAPEMQRYDVVPPPCAVLHAASSVGSTHAAHAPDLVVCAGFMRILSSAFLARFHLLSSTPDSDDFSEIEFKDGRTLESYSTVLKQADGVLMGDWKAGEKIAQNGRAIVAPHSLLVVEVFERIIPDTTGAPE